MSTLQEVQQRQFAEDHQRIMRALYDSVSKNNELHIQLRRMKEELVSTALRLQVATKIKQDDENTISSLRRVAEEARTEAIIANKQSHEANELIQSLKIEISSLKRKLKELTQLNNNSIMTGNMINGKEKYDAIAEFSVKADHEVDNLFNKLTISEPLAQMIGKKTVKNMKVDNDLITPFQVYKMEKYLYTPDNPYYLLQDHSREPSIDTKALRKVESRHGKRNLSNSTNSLPNLTNTSPIKGMASVIV